MKKRKRVLFLFLAPAVLLFLLVFVYPIIRTVLMSFFRIDAVTVENLAVWRYYCNVFSTALCSDSYQRGPL